MSFNINTQLSLSQVDWCANISMHRWLIACRTYYFSL